MTTAHDPERTSRSEEAPLERGRSALAGARWGEAVEALRGIAEASDGPADVRAEALEGLGLAGYWLEDSALAVDSHERAFAIYQAEGDQASAARMALWLADDHMGLLGQLAASNGWLERAERIVGRIVGTPEWAWLPVYRGHYVIQVEHDVPRAIALAEEGLSRARQAGAPHVEVVALALEGLARVLSGDVDRGMRRLDEASAAAVSRGIENLMSLGWALCYQIQGCDEIRDFPRAAEWCERVLEFCDRWGLQPIFSSCRIRYASILTWQGNWEAAEEQVDGLLARSSGRSAAAGAAQPSRTGLLRLAEIRRRQGRTDEAEELFERAGEHRWAILGRAGIALEREENEVAADLAERVLRLLPQDARAERADALLIHAIACSRGGDPDRAVASVHELTETAERVGTAPLLAAAAHARGIGAKAARQPGEALAAFEDALTQYDGGGAPHEAAIVRLELAEVLAALGRVSTAEREAERARAAFARLGASGDLTRTERFLARLTGPASGPESEDDVSDVATGAAAGPGQGLSDPRLTHRETEVLRLIGKGFSNAEIAERLFLSPHTVKRHVSNILRKLEVGSRAAAVAEASRSGVL